MIGTRRAPGASKASASTLCQKCLKRDNYECTTAAQDRPYKTRPSRSQQLANPKLVPQLASDTPNALLRTEGVADEQLARIKAEREKARKQKHGGRGASSGSRTPSPASRSRPRRRLSRSLSHSRSRSASSSRSVSTISTNRSPSPHNDMQDIAYPSQRDSQAMEVSRYSVAATGTTVAGKKRRRRHSTSSASSAGSIATASSYDNNYAKSHPHAVSDRNTRRRRSSISPGGRGRSRDSAVDGRPDRRQHHRRRRRSRSGSMDRSKIARHRHSLTPDGELRARGSARHAHMGEREDPGSQKEHGVRHRPASPRQAEGGDGRREQRGGRDEPGARPVITGKPRQRSLSPFSKRVALTRAMNGGGP